MKCKLTVVGAVQTNCYFYYDETSMSSEKPTVIIDPGAEAEKIVSFMEKNGLKPVLILLTHGHFDHISAAGALRDIYGIPVYAGNEEDILEDPEKNLSLSFTGTAVALKKDRGLREGEILPVIAVPLKNFATDFPIVSVPSENSSADFPAGSAPSENLSTDFPAAAAPSEEMTPFVRFRVLHTPGHTPGGVSYYDETNGILFSGDTLFRASYGRTDFPGGDENKLFQSIREKLLTLPEETRVLPGHGFPTDIRSEKKNFR